MWTSQNTAIAMTGAITSTTQARMSATKSSGSPENSEACAGAAAARAEKNRIAADRLLMCRSPASVAADDAELQLIEAGRAGRLTDVEPVPLVAEAQRDRRRNVPAH